MEEVVAPVLQRYVLAPLAVKTTDPPEQKVVEPKGVIVTVGIGFTVTGIAEDAAEQPKEVVPVTT